MTWPLKHWQAAIISLVLGLLAYFAISNQALRHDKESLQKEKQQLSGQLEWQNKTQKAVADIDLQRTQELEDAKSKIADLQRDVATGARKLRISASCQPAKPSGVDDAASPRLTDSAQRDYFTIRERIEIANKQIAGLQDYINQVCLAK
ncbi:Bacteriophage lysis protein [Serratia marcescens]|uniref:lysis protein n=1 Tax=Serratia marcescens TaxID=615 RepID=UPI0007455DB7|nr:lysis protein [Serratia marcescens]CUZ08002.1 Bacteriophage lysis protein [Serratia marcescens]CUZ35191.1 Bacteriophage lysis protein [Serratia marcescens]CUZ35443.1 Bacteriophage lysis protein [Serratia marcescens]CUZ35655.1 Bacteriophage lysis protein [Serratia marcescens]CVA43448.1 Bacteriophage lysis protein [Serratia marcescens]